MRVEEIQGVESAHGRKLNAVGVTTVDGLLERGRSRAGRSKLAEDTGIAESQILAWVNRADLMRIKGVGTEYSDLLEAAGVDSCLELSHRVPEHLQQKVEEINRSENLVRRLPTVHEVEQWVAAAGSMERAIEH